MNVNDNLGDLFARTISQNWDAPAFTEYEGESIRYRDVARKIAKIHMVFEDAGLEKGDKVALIGKNSTNWAVAYIATLTYGAVIVPVLHEFKSTMVHHIVTHSESRILFVGANMWESLNEEHMPGLAAIIELDRWRILHAREDGATADSIRGKIDKAFTARFPDGLQPDSLNYHPGTGDELAQINYTSGTSGFSKGVMQPYRALLSNLEFAEGAIALQRGDNVISVLPMAHAYGQAFEFLFPFMLGCHIHFLTRMPTPKIIIKAFGEIKPRIIILVPLIMEKIYKSYVLKQLSRRSVRLMMRMPILNKQVTKKFNDALTRIFGGNFIEVILGGAGLNSEVELFLKRIGFRYTVGYGMTECAPIMSYAHWDVNRLYSVGQNVPNMELRIHEPNPEGVGEIQVRGANVMLGYYKKDQLTQETFTEDGWMRSGDLASMDADGFVYIKGRRKNMILGPSGQNIYPEEIEGLLNTMPLVLESLIVERNGRLVALVVPDYTQVDELSMDTKTLDEEMEEYRLQLNRELPAFSQVAEFQLYPEEFEKTAKKSIKRFLYDVLPEKNRPNA